MNHPSARLIRLLSTFWMATLMALPSHAAVLESPFTRPETRLPGSSPTRAPLFDGLPLGESRVESLFGKMVLDWSYCPGSPDGCLVLNVDGIEANQMSTILLADVPCTSSSRLCFGGYLALARLETTLTPTGESMFEGIDANTDIYTISFRGERAQMRLQAIVSAQLTFSSSGYQILGVVKDPDGSVVRTIADGYVASAESSDECGDLAGYAAIPLRIFALINHALSAGAWATVAVGCTAATGGTGAGACAAATAYAGVFNAAWIETVWDKVIEAGRITAYSMCIDAVVGYKEIDLDEIEITAAVAEDSEGHPVVEMEGECPYGTVNFPVTFSEGDWFCWGYVSCHYDGTRGADEECNAECTFDPDAEGTVCVSGE